MFGRANITLAIGPHSSFVAFVHDTTLSQKRVPPYQRL